ncbi:hypothetical protein EZV62_008878 [Acer yangbiense]|uniref:Aconitase/3-isopropylmalate dehydratase large subunit alpha/beta/alpha domain-containing protein n=1 Tax=Acer yangbiense TaxID=1000413 RepID=A0A5C7IEB0_9ROSI|nr:hypothetical protein EZV62_008878 [Acer yangbiense]
MAAHIIARAKKEVCVVVVCGEERSGFGLFAGCTIGRKGSDPILEGDEGLPSLELEDGCSLLAPRAKDARPTVPVEFNLWAPTCEDVSDENAQTYEKAKKCKKINYYGTKRVTEPLLLLMQLSRSARIVNMTSFYGQLKYIDNKEANGWPTTVSAYKVSKADVNAYTRIIAIVNIQVSKYWSFGQAPVLELLLGAQLAPVFVAAVEPRCRMEVAASEHAFKEILTSLPKPGGGEFGKFYSLLALNDPRIIKHPISIIPFTGFISYRLPYSIRILLESAIRNCDNFQVTKEDVEKIIDWENTSPKLVEIPFKPARVLLQDFTGVPAVVDLACMRDSMKNLGSDPRKINPLVYSHTTMIDGLGVAGWGVGGIKAEAAMLGQEMAELEARREQVKLNVARKVGGPDLKSFIQQFESASEGDRPQEASDAKTGVRTEETEAEKSDAKEKKCAVVTGANKGIGLEISRQLASNGIAVILTARDEKKGTEAVQGSSGN